MFAWVLNMPLHAIHWSGVEKKTLIYGNWGVKYFTGVGVKCLGKILTPE